MKSKLIIILSCAGVAVAVIVACILLFVGGNKDSYRIVKIFEVDGNASVNRESMGEITPYNNMLLESGDDVALAKGDMTLKMDEDKFAYVEEDTEFSIIAEGTAEDSKTKIELMKGAITNEIQNKLSEGSSYEVNTPNSTMAVRGTTFRVEAYSDENGVFFTKVCVFDGEVSTRLAYPDGTVADETVAVEAGKEVIIFEDDKTTDYYTEVSDIDYSNLSDGTKKLIEEILGISLETDEPDTDASDEDETETDDTDESDGQDDTTLDQEDEPEDTPAPEESPQNTPETGQNDTPAETPQTPPAASQTPQQPADSFTVTFMYQGAVFGTQNVKNGACAAEPTLMPASSGSWDFDFATPITQDTQINWK